MEDILVNKPDFTVFVPRQPEDPALRDPGMTGDTFNDHFHVIRNPADGLLYAFWTQASREMDIDQHVAFSKSGDGGHTWTEPAVIAGSRDKRHPGLLASFQQPMLSRSGRLYCLWNQQVTNDWALCGAMVGAYSDDNGDTWSAPRRVPFPERMDADPADPLVPPSWCNWQRPLRLGEGGKFLVGCSRHGKAPYDEKSGPKVEFWQFENIDDDPEFVAAHADATMKVHVEVTELMGSETYLYFSTSGKEENVIARVDPRTKTRAGDDVKVALDTTRLHFFDKDTEETIMNR